MTEIEAIQKSTHDYVSSKADLSVPDKLRMVEFCFPIFQSIAIARNKLKGQRDSNYAASRLTSGGRTAEARESGTMVTLPP